MANRSVFRSTLFLSRAHLLLLRHNNNNKPSLSNPLFQESSLETLKPFSSSSFTITNHNLFFSPSRSLYSFFQPDKHKDSMAFGKDVKLHSSSAITQGESIIVKRKPGRPRKIRPVVDETVSLESSTPSPSLSSLSQTQKRGRGRLPGSGKKKEVQLESSPVSSVPSSSLSQSPETQKRGRGQLPGTGKKKEVELESSPVSFLPSLSLSEIQKRGRGRPPGSEKKNEMLKQQSLKEQREQWLKNRREEIELMDQREEQKLKEQSKFVGQEQKLKEQSKFVGQEHFDPLKKNMLKWEQRVKNLREERELMDQREEQKLKEQSKFVGQEHPNQLKKLMLKQQSSKEQWEQRVKNLREERELMYQREEQKLKEQSKSKFVGQGQGGHEHGLLTRLSRPQLG